MNPLSTSLELSNPLHLALAFALVSVALLAIALVPVLAVLTLSKWTHQSTRVPATPATVFHMTHVQQPTRQSTPWFIVVGWTLSVVAVVFLTLTLWGVWGVYVGA